MSNHISSVDARHLISVTTRSKLPSENCCNAIFSGARGGHRITLFFENVFLAISPWRL